MVPASRQHGRVTSAGLIGLLAGLLWHKLAPAFEIRIRLCFDNIQTFTDKMFCHIFAASPRCTTTTRTEMITTQHFADRSQAFSLSLFLSYSRI